MAVRRLWYLVALLGSWIFYIAYGEWLSWIVLWLIGLLPWFSLLVSLPAMVTFRAVPEGPDWLILDSSGELSMLGICPLPHPPFRGRLVLHRCFTGEKSRYNLHSGIPTAHCGGFTVTIDKLRVCDYLGLFAFPVKANPAKQLLIRPIPRPVSVEADLQRYTALTWRPKFGGGFAENHELRLYRPGDSLNQVHWKLSAKTGKLILREPMVPVRGKLLLTMDLSGTPEELDRKFGRLLWLGTYLLEKEAPFDMTVLTGEGIAAFSIRQEPDFTKALDELLCAPAATEGSIRDQVYAASWQYHVGGEPDEA